VGPLDSTVLYKLYDKGDAASIRPILGALLLPIPHTLWSDKPMAGSTDSTNLEVPFIECSRTSRTVPSMTWASFGFGARLLGRGWIWLCVAALMTGWIWNKLLAWAEHAQSDSIAVIVLVFTAGLPIDGFFSALTPLFAYVRLLWITLLPLSLILMVLKDGCGGKTRRVFSSRSNSLEAKFANIHQAHLLTGLGVCELVAIATGAGRLAVLDGSESAIDVPNGSTLDGSKLSAG